MHGVRREPLTFNVGNTAGSRYQRFALRLWVIPPTAPKGAESSALAGLAGVRKESQRVHDMGESVADPRFIGGPPSKVFIGVNSTRGRAGHCVRIDVLPNWGIWTLKAIGL